MPTTTTTTTPRRENHNGVIFDVGFSEPLYDAICAKAAERTSWGRGEEKKSKRYKLDFLSVPPCLASSPQRNHPLFWSLKRSRIDYRNVLFLWRGLMVEVIPAGYRFHRLFQGGSFSFSEQVIFFTSF